MTVRARGTGGGHGPALRRRALLVLGLSLSAGILRAEARRESLVLVMFRTPGCPWCRAWDREVRDGYLASELGRRLGLVELDLHVDAGHGMALEGPVSVAPVFLLVRRAMDTESLAGAREIGRLVGYPGADFFWGYLDRMVASTDAADSAG